MLKKNSIMTKLLLAFFVVGVVPAIIISVTSLNNGGGALKNAQYSKLESIRETKKTQILDQFKDYKTNMEFLKNIVGTYEEEGFNTLTLATNQKRDKIQKLFSSIDNELNAVVSHKDVIEADKIFRTISSKSGYSSSSEEFRKNWDRFNSIFSNLTKTNNYEDIYLINASSGVVMFSNDGGKDIGTNLRLGQGKSEGLGLLYEKVMASKGISYSDFSSYSPKDKKQCFFAGIPVYKNGKLETVIALRYGVEKFNEIMQDYTSLGKTGETYLAGLKDGKMRFRSDLQTIGDGKYLVGTELGANTPEYWTEAFAGKKVKEVYTDSKGKLVMVVGEKLEIKGLEWIIISKMDIEEILTKKIEGRDVYDIYREKFNFYDFFLIHPNGEIFYSVGKEKDYHTNIISGTYARSGLGNLTRKVLEKKEYVFEDFSIYEPSNTIASFVGIPYIYNGKTQFIIGAQISLDKINKVMAHMTEMGKTGETFLVGQDGLMRSDSSLDAENRSVENSFRKKLTMDSKDVRSGLKGSTGTAELEDYLGKNVISAYTTVEIGDTKWALISKMNSSEVMSSNRYLTLWIVVILGASIAGITLFAIVFTEKISKPILKLNEWAKRVAMGENEILEITDSKDEIGMVSESFKNVVESMQKITSICKNIAIGDLSEEFRPRSENDPLGDSINTMKENFLEVVGQAKRISSGDYTSDIIPRSDKDELSLSLNNMVEALRKAEDDNSKQQWTKSGQAQLSDAMQGDQRIEGLSNNIINKVCSYMSIDVGTIFIRQKKLLYKLAGSYAYENRENRKEFIVEGEGLLGQILLEKKIRVIKNREDEHMTVSSSMVETKVRNVVVLPCIHNNEVRALLELGKVGEFSEAEIELLKLVSENIAIGIEACEAQEEMKILLDKTLKQAEELQQQQEELRQSNEELEEQARALRESEERLKQQQEELRQTNEELEEQTKILRDSEEKLQIQQEELRVTNEELEERTFSLENQRKEVNEKNEVLKRAQQEIEMKARALETASKYKSEFLANMSHELRTPLNSILILSQLLGINKNKTLTETEIDYAKTINSSGADLLNLINDILDLSKVEAGKMEVHIEKIDVQEFVDGIDRLFKHVAKNKGLEFHVEVAEDIPKEIHSDEQRLSQVIKNIMSNAIKFTEKGSIDFKVFNPNNRVLKRKSLIGKELIGFSVKDSGIGIPTEKINHIFEAFKQGDGTTSRKFGGTGLGLSISREFIRLFGGEIQVESQEGKGSEFIVILPIESESSGKYDVEFNAMEYIENNFGTPEKSQEKVEIKEFISQRITTEKPKEMEKEELPELFLEDVEVDVEDNEYILIIEDDTKFSSILEEMAQNKGFKVIVAGTGEKGLAIIEKATPSALILDIGLPGISGWEVLKRVKKNPKLKKLPVHIMSAIDSSDKFKELGILDFIQKPVSIDKLESAFDRIKSISINGLKKVLVVEDNRVHSNSIRSFIMAHNHEVEILSCETGEESIKLLVEDEFDCMILDLGLADISGMDLLTKIRKEDISQIPIIIYTGKELSREETEKLEKYAETVILKGPQSMERLLDETNLFLHHIEKKMNEKTHRVVKSEYEKEENLVGKRALVVDDDMRNVFALTSLLESKGIVVEPARNGLEALEKIKKDEQYDVVLMDIMMPEMDGYTATRAIRKIRKYENTPIIALTAKAMKEDRNKCINAGANDYMSKPIEMDKLINLLRVWLY